ncbi:hypothetical protein LOY52_12840 [Pseudomonas sp. B21-051]|uniref:hypothetical protein n=1 Tax=Pseudomonas sp. B21-051 TaxID=2895491 RepID=UPI0021606944|nr:hypothetical protein [Pseudomonas sp. B21-051]UVK90909.1 hypothetical protein LOY52_12840 [Pseudomonas sp. B21-051]
MKALKAMLLVKFEQYSVSQRFYLASVVTYFITFVASLCTGTSTVTIGTTVAAALIMCGFIAWCIPFARWLHTAWDKPFAKTPIIIMHLLALLISTACARFAVAETLGLPPQSFDLTVSFLALLFYIPSWLFVVAILLGLTAMLITVIAMISLLFEAAWQHMTQLAAFLGFQAKFKQSRSMIMFHAAGALIISVLFTMSYGYLTDNFSPAFKAVTKVIALRSDFHKVPNYPYVRTGEYVHPLENGFIAYAREKEDKSVIIGVRLQPAENYDVVVSTIPPLKVAMTTMAEHVKKSPALVWLLGAASTQSDSILR